MQAHLYLCVYVWNIGRLSCVSPQAAVVHLPASSVPAERVPAGTYAAGEVEAQVADYYW